MVYETVSWVDVSFFTFLEKYKKWAWAGTKQKEKQGKIKYKSKVQ